MGLDAPFFLYILGQCLKTHIGVHWLRQEVVASCLKSHFAVAAESVGCKGNDWKVRILRLQYPCSFQTIHLRHLDVHQHKINASLLYFLYGITAVDGTYNLIMFLQQIAHQYVVAIIVFCNKNLFHNDYVFCFLLFLP